MNYIREFFYLRKSDRKVILTLLSVIVIALVVIFMTGGSNESNELTPADTVLVKHDYRDSTRRQPYREQTKTVYVRTKVVYRDTSYRRGKALKQYLASAPIMPARSLRMASVWAVMSAWISSMKSRGFRSMPRIISPSKTLRPVNSISTPSRSMSSGNILTSISIRQRPLPNTVAYMAPSTL